MSKIIPHLQPIIHMTGPANKTAEQYVIKMNAPIINIPPIQIPKADPVVVNIPPMESPIVNIPPIDMSNAKISVNIPVLKLSVVLFAAAFVGLLAAKLVLKWLA